MKVDLGIFSLVQLLYMESQVIKTIWKDFLKYVNSKNWVAHKPGRKWVFSSNSLHQERFPLAGFYTTVTATTVPVYQCKQGDLVIGYILL